MGLLAKLPESVKYPLIVLKRLRGKTPRTCPICSYHGLFKASGQPPRYDSVCGGCGSRERHRLFVMAVDRLDLLRDDDSIIHFAPERVLKKRLQGRPGYQTADIMPERGDLTLNLEQIDLPANRVDVVIANHVLEHVDDKKALDEILRILKPGGRMIATVPLVEGWETYENPEVRSQRERTLHFGQNDHVRYYGRDFRDRVKAAGFDLQEFVASGQEVVEHGLIPGERVFVGVKPQ